MATLKYFDQATGTWKYILQGPKGDQGEGLIPGGSTDQVLAKASNNDYDFKFVTSPADKNYEITFNPSTFVIINHNLNKYPSVLVKDSAGDEVEGMVEHINKNSLTITFSNTFGGVVSCN